MSLIANAMLKVSGLVLVLVLAGATTYGTLISDSTPKLGGRQKASTPLEFESFRSTPAAPPAPELILYVVSSEAQAEHVRYWEWFEGVHLAGEIPHRPHEFSITIVGLEGPDEGTIEASLIDAANVSGRSYRLVDLRQR